MHWYWHTCCLLLQVRLVVTMGLLLVLPSHNVLQLLLHGSLCLCLPLVCQWGDVSVTPL